MNSKYIQGILALWILLPCLPASGQTFPFAALAVRQSIDLNGKNILVDSFDSGLYDPSKAKDRGNVIANGSIIDSAGTANVTIHGRVQVGPGGQVTVGNRGGIGQRAWTLLNPGQIQPGYLSHDAAATFAEHVLPYTVGLMPMPGFVVTTGFNSVLFTNYYDHVLHTGDYCVNTLSGKTYVRGDARLVALGGVNLTGADLIIVGPNGSLELHAGGTNCVIGGMGIINFTKLAANCSLFCTPTVTNVSFVANGEFIGTLFAPQAAVHMVGGHVISDFLGALVADSVTFQVRCCFHFDESLLSPMAQLSPPNWSSNNEFVVNINGVLGFPYAVAVSTDLNAWTPVLTNIAPFTFTDSSATNSGQRYYRALRVR